MRDGALSHRPAARFWRTETASSLAEFAVICPVLLIFMMMGIQLIGYIDATRRVERVAASVSEMISQAVPPTGSTTALVTTMDLHFAYDSALVLFPQVMTDAPRANMAWWQAIEIDFAGIQFNPTGKTTCRNPANLSGCYSPQVMWVSTIGTHTRSCSTPLKPQANAAPTNPGMLPNSIYGPGGLVVIDVYYTFTPTFAARLLPSLTVVRSAYVKPRYATLIKLDTTSNDLSAAACPGF